MIILTLRTDKPEAEIGLYDGQTKTGYEIWEGHRKLAETIHTKIEALLTAAHKSWHDVQGVVVFEGPGSFTGLRIGIATANAIAAGVNAPIVATQGEDWIQTGITRLLSGDRDEIALPFYGQDVHITTPRR